MLTKSEQVALAAKLLKLSIEKAIEYSGVIEEYSALYVSIPEKGGASLIVGKDGTVLFANSSIDSDIHLQEFLNGRRTPITDFDPK